jgi:hypothetical protein
MKKSGQTFIAAGYRTARVHGLIPSRDNIEAMRLAQTPAPKFNAAMLLQHTDPVLRVEGITKGLGLDTARETSWNKFLDDQLNGGTNELVMRKALYERMMGERMEPTLRRALFQKAMNYYRGKMKKSLVQVVTPDELLEKAEARGGSYHRRVPKKKGKGFDYIYDPDKYAGREDAHVSGDEAKKARITKAVSTLVEGSEKGCCGVSDMKTLAKKFGSKEVASHLKKQCADGGSMEYKGGKFKMKKSLESTNGPDFKFVIGS